MGKQGTAARAPGCGLRLDVFRVAYTGKGEQERTHVAGHESWASDRLSLPEQRAGLDQAVAELREATKGKRQMHSGIAFSGCRVASSVSLVLTAFYQPDDGGTPIFGVELAGGETAEAEALAILESFSGFATK